VCDADLDGNVGDLGGWDSPIPAAETTR
jgi:hypothetical protein